MNQEFLSCLSDEWRVCLQPASLKSPICMRVFADSSFNAVETAWALINFATLNTSYKPRARRI